MLRISDVKSSLQQRGISISKRDREYRVNYAPGGIEETAYYTDDLEDAYFTGIKMIQERGQ